VALDLALLGRRLAAAGRVTATEHLVRLLVGEHELTVFGDGRAIVKGTSDLAQARSLYARYVGA
jgi:molybdopterin-synthase adenylyltransferase